MGKIKNKMTSVLATAFGLFILNCSSSPNESLTASNTAQDTILKKSSLDLNRYPMTKTVCDPFDNPPADNLKRGLKANLSYRLAGMPFYSTSKDYLEKTWPSEKTLFFSQINVPTRIFDSGFVTESGDVLKTDQGDRLIEYFGVKFQSSLSLADGDEEGLYDIALISDDGSSMNIGAGPGTRPGTEEVLINNEGDHSTAMGCSKKYLNMKKGQRIPFNVTYYQGPRYFIANVMIWRKVNSESEPKDGFCGLGGDSAFYDANPNAQSGIRILESRGWKVVKPDNFILDDVLDYNPCVPAKAPVITEFRLNETTLSEAWFSWKTDIASGSQLLVTEAGGTQVLTASDNNLRLVHSLRIEGLKPSTTYRVKAISVTEDLGRGESEEIQFTTP